MRKLINTIIALVLIIVIVLLALPFGTGLWLKNNYQKILTHLSKPHDVTLKLVKFDYGWFVSNATVQVTIPTETNQPMQFIVKQRILNGPYIFSKINHEKKLRFAKGLIYTISDNPNFAFRASTLIHFNNSSDSIFHANNIIITNKQQTVLKGIYFTLTYKPVSQQLISDAEINSLMLSEKQRPILAIEGLISHNALQRAKSLWYGKRTVTLKKLTIYPTPDQSIHVEDAILESQQTTENSTTAFTFSGHAKSVKNDYFNLAPIDLKLSITKINTAAFNALVDKALNFEHSSPITPIELYQLSSPFIDLLSHGISVSLDHLTFGTEDGQVAMRGQFDLPRQDQSPDLAWLIENAQGSAEIKMPLSWLKKQLTYIYQNKKVEIDNQQLTPEQIANQQIQYWLTNKKLIQEGDDVQLKITYDKGKLLINDLPPSYQAPQTTP